MGRKSNLKQYHSVTNGSMAANITSPVSSIEFLDNIGAQFNWTGSPVGYFQVQVSADYNQDQNGNVINAGNWTPIYFADTRIAGTNIPTTLGSPIFVDLNQLSAPYIRIVYTRTSGSGTLNAYICAKVS